MHLKMPSGKWRPFCSRGDELTHWTLRGVAIIFKNMISTLLIQDSGCALAMKFLSSECHRTSLISNHGSCNALVPSGNMPYGVIGPQWATASTCNTSRPVDTYTCQGSRSPLAQTINHFTHLPLDKMADISQTIHSDALSWMKNLVFWLKFQWSLFQRVHLTITQHWLRWCFGAE